MWTEFNPKTHQKAYSRGQLFEMKTQHVKGVILTRYEKVTEDEDYQLALLLPIYFVVKEPQDESEEDPWAV